MPHHSPYHEKDLLLHLSQGDEAALTHIYKLYWQPLFINAYQVLKDKSVCEDIIQEIFLQLWMRREQLAIQDSLQAYLYAATRYQVFGHLKKMASRETLMARAGKPSPVTYSDDTLMQKDLHEQVEKVVATLPDKCKLIYQLSREAHLSHKEIAEKLSISTKTVENQLTIALHRLRTHLKEAMMVIVLYLFP